jgi:mannose-6-phosphate isomerase
MCIDGAFEIEYNKDLYQYKKGDTVLIPAAMDYYVINGKLNLYFIVGNRKIICTLHAN